MPARWLGPPMPGATPACSALKRGGPGIQVGLAHADQQLTEAGPLPVLRLCLVGVATGSVGTDHC